MNFVFAAMAMAQNNLVPNPSFEDTTYCVGWPPPQVEALHWHTANTATPDIWDCDLSNTCGYHLMDPNDPGIQQQGYKYAYDGDRFAGGYQWFGPGSSNTREYLSARLTQPLQAGVIYRVSMYCARPNGVNGAIEHIGAHFGPDSLYEQYPTTLPLVPQALLRSDAPGYLSDTAWVEVADTITATGNEAWITFGTFADADEVEGIWLGWGSYPPAVYYYMDLISVVALDGQSVVEQGANGSTLLVQGADVVWNGGAVLDELVLVDGAGRVVRTLNGSGHQARHPLPSDLASGVYLAVARAGNDRYWVRFIR
ncbi:MAG: hypothetical protein R2811_13650 [Flavobacteriales bacterium]